MLLYVLRLTKELPDQKDQVLSAVGLKREEVDLSEGDASIVYIQAHEIGEFCYDILSCLSVLPVNSECPSPSVDLHLFCTKDVTFHTVTYFHLLSLKVLFPYQFGISSTTCDYGAATRSF